MTLPFPKPAAFSTLIVSVTLLFTLPVGCTFSGKSKAQICSDPAPLKGAQSDSSSSYVVVYESSRDWTKEEIENATEELSEKHSFEAEHIYSRAIQGFAADLSSEALDGVRCEASVEYVSHDDIGELE
jgi:hypothetical protein